MLTTENLAGKKIFVTGGTGFLGSHLLPLLHQAGAETFCLARSPQSAARLPAGAIPVIGNCGSLADVEKGMSGCDIVIHMAAMLFGDNWQSYLMANGTAAANIALAAGNTGVPPKVIFISSLAAAGPCAKAPGIDESCSPGPVSAYGWSKLLAEQIITARLRQISPSAELIILRPPIIYGSGDRGLLPLFKSCNAGIGLSPGQRDFPVSIIHASDAARAIVLAAANPQANGIYHLSDGSGHTMEEICRAMGHALGRKRIRVLKPPLWLMGSAAALISAACGFRGKIRSICHLPAATPPNFNLDKFREASRKGWLANSRRIECELGFKALLALPEGMAEAVNGYRNMGVL